MASYTCTHTHFYNGSGIMFVFVFKHTRGMRLTLGQIHVCVTQKSTEYKLYVNLDLPPKSELSRRYF